MRPLHFLQCLAWTLLVVAGVSACGGILIARSIDHTLRSTGATFTRSMNEAAR